MIGLARVQNNLYILCQDSCISFSYNIDINIKTCNYNVSIKLGLWQGHVNATMLQSGKELEITTYKSHKGNNNESGYVSTEMEGESTPHAKEVVKEEKEELYVPPHHINLIYRFCKD